MSITDPPNNTVLTAPASFTLAASAVDNDGNVVNLEFYNGANSLGIDSSDPYSVPIINLAAGTYLLSAVATDNGGASATSAPITIIVTNALPNAVTLFAPAWDGSTFMFSFATQVGRQYEVHFIDVLGGGDWHLLTNLTGTGDTLTVTNFSPSVAQRTYRVESK